ncbi:MAG TPA: NAD(+)/NADH kinase [Polyangiaceae bacterium]|nr:NAD(+)/NADH kinase [Polyangiaceae bacterium]
MAPTRMNKTKKPRVIVVAKRSSLARLEDGEVDQRARKLLRSGDATVRKWRPAHEDHVRTLERVEKTLSRLGAEVLILHGSHAVFDTRGSDLVVSVGGDGTLLAASHSVSGVPILGVNSAPRYSVGFFCGAKGRAVEAQLARALSGELPQMKLSRMAVRINGQLRSERVLNEALICHIDPAATSNYILEFGKRSEEQKSSGIWVGTAAGSTGALRSAGGEIMPFGSRQLQFVVREPYVAGGRNYKLTRGLVPSTRTLIVKSKMHHARVFLDGPYRALPVRLGDHVQFETSRDPLTVLGLEPSR